MKRIPVVVLLLTIAGFSQAATPHASFAGQWIFDPTQSKNIGMMAEATIKTVITQSKSEVVVDDTSTFKGQGDTQHTVYELSGEPVANISMMTGQATTRSHWEANRLITEWKSSGAIAGTVNQRVETRYLSPDGNTMFVESTHPGKDPMVIVYTRSK
jgi:hypothetical protein